MFKTDQLTHALKEHDFSPQIIKGADTPEFRLEVCTRNITWGDCHAACPSQPACILVSGLSEAWAALRWEGRAEEAQIEEREERKRDGDERAEHRKEFTSAAHPGVVENLSVALQLMLKESRLLQKAIRDRACRALSEWLPLRVLQVQGWGSWYRSMSTRKHLQPNEVFTFPLRSIKIWGSILWPRHRHRVLLEMPSGITCPFP